jgi:hypothetical protein
MPRLLSPIIVEDSKELRDLTAEAEGYRDESGASASTATAQAGIATTQAGIATTQANNASGSATAALGFRNEAETFKNQAGAISASGLDVVINGSVVEVDGAGGLTSGSKTGSAPQDIARHQLLGSLAYYDRLPAIAFANVAPTVASATSIIISAPVTFVSGTTAIETIAAPDLTATGGAQITLIPTGIFTTTTAGNIALATTAVVSRALTLTYDSATAKWYPSY